MIGYANETIAEMEETIDLSFRLRRKTETNIIISKYHSLPFATNTLYKSSGTGKFNFNGRVFDYLELKNLLIIILACFPETYSIIKILSKKNNLEILTTLSCYLQKEKKISLKKEITSKSKTRKILTANIFAKYYNLATYIKEIEEYETITSLIFENELTYRIANKIKPPIKILFDSTLLLENILYNNKILEEPSCSKERQYYYIEYLKDKFELFKISFNDYKKLNKSTERSQLWLRKEISGRL